MLFYLITLIRTESKFYDRFPYLLHKGFVEIAGRLKNERQPEEESEFKNNIKEYIKECNLEMVKYNKNLDWDFNLFRANCFTASDAVYILREFQKFLNFLSSLLVDENLYDFYKTFPVKLKKKIELIFYDSFLYLPNRLNSISDEFAKFDIHLNF